jgi:Gpi18-like mannosyltransferase
MYIPYVILGIVFGLIVIGVTIALLFRKRKAGIKAEEINYQAFFIMGISFLPMGIVFSATVSPGFLGIAGLGAVYLALGLKHRDKWEKKGKKQGNKK